MLRLTPLLVSVEVKVIADREYTNIQSLAADHLHYSRTACVSGSTCTKLNDYYVCPFNH